MCFLYTLNLYSDKGSGKGRLARQKAFVQKLLYSSQTLHKKIADQYIYFSIKLEKEKKPIRPKSHEAVRKPYWAECNLVEIS